MQGGLDRADLNTRENFPHLSFDNRCHPCADGERGGITCPMYGTGPYLLTRRSGRVSFHHDVDPFLTDAFALDSCPGTVALGCLRMIGASSSSGSVAFGSRCWSGTSSGPISPC